MTKDNLFRYPLNPSIPRDQYQWYWIGGNHPRCKVGPDVRDYQPLTLDDIKRRQDNNDS